MDAYVALIEIQLHFPEAHDLKGKRKELASVKAQLHSRHGVTVAEVEHQDRWQRATLAAALTSGSMATLQTGVDRVCRWLDARYPEGVRVELTLASFADLEGIR